MNGVNDVNGVNGESDGEDASMHVERSGGGNDVNVPFGTGVGWSGEQNSGVFTFAECMSEVNLQEGEIVVDVDRGCFFYADHDGTLIPTEDEDKSNHVALPLLDRYVLSQQLLQILNKYQSQTQQTQQTKHSMDNKEDETREEGNRTVHDNKTALDDFDRNVRMSFCSCLASMIAGYRDYLFYLNDEMPVFNKIDFMLDRILYNRRRLMTRCRQGTHDQTDDSLLVEPEDELDLERSRRFLSTLFETQSFALFLDEAALTVNKVFHALCYDIASHEGEASQVELLLNYALLERHKTEQIVCVGSQQRNYPEDAVDAQCTTTTTTTTNTTNNTTNNTTTHTPPRKDHTIGPFESQEHSQLMDYFSELVGDLRQVCALEDRRSFSLPTLTYDALRAPRLIRATHAARVLFRNGGNGNENNSSTQHKNSNNNNNNNR